MFRIDDIINVIDGKPLNGLDTSLGFRKICIDSRKVTEGDIFLALKGKRFDGHDFVEDANRKGVVCSIVSKKTKSPAILVEDTSIALRKLGKFYREFFNPTIIGITGSVGKTTTKEVLASFLSLHAPTLRTRGNYNNLIGVPLTLLELKKKYRYAVIEMGTNCPGEIKSLSDMVKPDIGVVLNTAPSHLEGFGTRERVAEEKMGLLFSMEKGYGVYNVDDPFLSKFADRIRINTITFGIKNKANVMAKDIKLYPDSTEFTVDGLKIKTNLTGLHNVYNLLSVISVLKVLGIDIESSSWLFEFLRLPKMRMEKHRIRGVTIYNDSYNANPASFKAAIDTISLLDGRKIVIMGGMYELGDKSYELHQEVARYALNRADLVVCVGEEARDYIIQGSKKLKFFDTKEDAVKYLSGVIKKGDVVLIKGSRGAEMEKLFEKLKEVI